MQMFADVLRIPIRVTSDTEMGTKGVAITTSVAAGIHPSIEEAVAAMVRPGELVEPHAAVEEIYAEKLECFRALVAALDPVWTRM